VEIGEFIVYNTQIVYSLEMNISGYLKTGVFKNFLDNRPTHTHASLVLILIPGCTQVSST